MRGGGQDDGAQGHQDYSRVKMARSVRDETSVQPRVRESNHRHSLGKSAGMASTTTATNDLRGYLDVSGDSAQHVGGRTRSEQ